MLTSLVNCAIVLTQGIQFILLKSHIHLSLKICIFKKTTIILLKTISAHIPLSVSYCFYSPFLNCQIFPDNAEAESQFLSYSN